MLPFCLGHSEAVDGLWQWLSCGSAASFAEVAEAAAAPSCAPQWAGRSGTELSAPPERRDGAEGLRPGGGGRGRGRRGGKGEGNSCSLSPKATFAIGYF